jgi:hypothetical protein
MNLALKVQLLRTTRPLNASADEAALERYFAAVVEGESPEALEELVCATWAIEPLERFAAACPGSRARVTAQLAILDVMEA